VAISKTIPFVCMDVCNYRASDICFRKSPQEKELLFCCSRFFLIYAICILFDYRDRDQDKQEGIRHNAISAPTVLIICS
jgi:hypothetical protein